MDCLFCKIAQHQLPADVVYEDGEIMAFHDVTPRAPMHILLIPKMHISTMNDVSAEHTAVLGSLLLKARDIAIAQHGDDAGYRLVFNVNPQGGQTVYHIHLHLLGGRQLTWPPG